MSAASGGPPAGARTTVDDALAAARRLGLDRLDAQLLLAHRLDRPRTWLLAHGDCALQPVVADAYAADCARRADAWPLAYLVGQREFHGLALQVTPDVLDPRPDTETLVDWVLDALGPAGDARRRVLDLGTGSGAIALALARARPDVDVTATDLSPAALAVARANARRLQLPVAFAEGAWWQAVPGRRFHLVVSNPPYVAAADPHWPALKHEPALALDGGPDGLHATRRIVAGAPAHLEAGAWLLLEHGAEQADAVRALLDAAGFADTTTRADLAGLPRCTGGRWPARNE